MRKVQKHQCAQCEKNIKIKKVGIIGALSFEVVECPSGHVGIRYRLAEVG